MKFNNNAFKDCSVSADNSRGGAVIFAGSSNISSTNVIFKYNDDFITSPNVPITDAELEKFIEIMRKSTNKNQRTICPENVRRKNK